MSYQVKEVFNTIQGEGGRAGRRSVFVRFAGCNLWSGDPKARLGRGACALWCDTDFVGGTKMSLERLLYEMDKLWPFTSPDAPPRWCVLTGGEPMLQVDTALMQALKGSAWSIAIETNGTLDPEGVASLADWITLSPKAGPPLVLRSCTELKVVLPGGSAGWREEALVKLVEDLHPLLLFVQPQDAGPAEGDTARHVRRCIEWVFRHPQWALSLQTHKMIGLP